MTTETLTRARNACSYAGMSNVLDDQTQQQICALGRLGCTAFTHPGSDRDPAGDRQRLAKALATDLVPAPLRASGLRCYTATNRLLGLIASIIAGQLWDRVGHAAVFLYDAAFAAVSIIAVLGSSRNTPKVTNSSSPTGTVHACQGHDRFADSRLLPLL